MLTDEQKQRYLRNIILPEITEIGQEKLLQARVLIIGAGGLGSPALYYLAAAGIGNIGIIDDDVVELSNLQRQVIHGFNDLGRKKVESARDKIKALNKDIKLEIYDKRANLETLAQIADNYDYILDACDNFPTRFVINEFCVKARKTLIFAAVKGFLGQVSVFDFSGKNRPRTAYHDSRGLNEFFQNSHNYNISPCYTCFNPNIVDESFSLPLSEKGILGSVAGTIGALQATSTIKEILGIGESLVGKILIFDFLKNEFRKVNLQKNKNCKVCGFN